MDLILVGTWYKQYLLPQLHHNLLLMRLQMIYLETLFDLLFQIHLKQIIHPLFHRLHSCFYSLIPQGNQLAYAVPKQNLFIALNFNICIFSYQILRYFYIMSHVPYFLPQI